MKIGVYINQLDPTIGGGFTFESSIITNLAINRKKYDHEFVLISDYNNKQLKIFSNEYGIKYFSLFGNQFFGKYHKYLSIFKIELRENFFYIAKFLFKNNYIEKKLFNEGIQATLSLNPRVLSYEIPFFLTCWDLNHLTDQRLVLHPGCDQPRLNWLRILAIHT